MSEGRRYQVEGVLGKGGFGTVYKAQLLGEGGFTRAVALKVLNADMADMEDVARRLRDEARLLGLLRHRAILHVDGLVRMDGRWTVVMEYIEGADLQRVARGGGVPLGPALEIVGEVASALHVAYTTTAPSGLPLKLLHRDIKPPNILLTSAGEVKVLDFGIARAEFGNREAMTKSVLYGSVGYMAPERMDFEELPEGDVYALGTVFYEILVGSPLGKASIRPERHQALVDEASELLRRKLGGTPPDFHELLTSMLAYDPEDRPSAREVERRCRTMRQHVQGPWLRDWAEHAVPPLLAHRDLLPADELSGNLLAESGGVSLLQDGEAVPSEPIDNSTMAFDTGADVEAEPVEEPSAGTALQRGAGAAASGPATSRRRIPAGGGLLGPALWTFGVLGCLGALGLGGVVFLVMVMAVAVSEADPDPGYEVYPGDGVDIIDENGVVVTPPPPPVVQPGTGPLASYGPPKGPHLRAALKGPWGSMGLPIEPGVPSYADDKTLVVQYGSGGIRPIADAWSAALRRNGWEPEYDFDGDNVISITMLQGDARIALAVSPSMGNNIVSLTVTD